MSLQTILAVAAAKAVQADDKATQDAVDAAKKAVDDAVKGLVEKSEEPPPIVHTP